MAKDSTSVSVGKRTIELSNLKKCLYPEAGILKAEIIQYYLQIAPTILKHIKGRPLSLVRFPDGIHGENFFQKNTPGWAPDWIEHTKVGGEGKDYVLATEEASLVWLANLACLEIHQMHSRQPHFDKPNYIVYDLDPPEGYDFRTIVDIAFKLKEHVEQYGYHVFVKTTGGKGLHVVTPIEPKWDFDTAFQAAKDVAQPFMLRNANTTLHIKKENRAGRVLIDIYRNRPSQTIVSAYSMRGNVDAAVSLPMTWDDLAKLQNGKEIGIHQVLQYVVENGDAWDGIDAYAVELHTQRNQRKQPKSKKEKKSDTDLEEIAPSQSPATTETKSAKGKSGNIENTGKTDDQTASKSNSRNHAKTRMKDSEISKDEAEFTLEESEVPNELKEYDRKRSFSRTPEPSPEKPEDEGHAFVLHRHHASRLHYDLRLEKEGTLKCWAIPKGIPPRPGIKRLAVQTEDHPVKYLDFEGNIARGQYGAGDMWIFAKGKYIITKEKKDGFYVRLSSKEITTELRMIHTKNQDWLLERLDTTQIDWFKGIDFMLASHSTEVPTGDDYVYELKWDGIRVLVIFDEGKIQLKSRNGKDITNSFPELLDPESFRASNGIFDGEIVVLDSEGKPKFDRVIKRMQQTTESGVKKIKAKYPAVCYLFDCVYLDGRPIVNTPLTLRKEWLKDAIKSEYNYRPSEMVTDGQAFFHAASSMGLEGIMAKKKDSVYQPGRRSPFWIKVKSRSTEEAFLIGYTKGKGDREKTFGALHLAVIENGNWKYRGKVGSGFDDSLMVEITKLLKTLPEEKKLIENKLLDDAISVWVKPEWVCEIRYASYTPDGSFREPVFLRLRPDLTNNKV